MAREEQVMHHGVAHIAMVVYITIAYVGAYMQITAGSWIASGIIMVGTIVIIALANVIIQACDQLYAGINRDNRHKEELKTFIQDLRDEIGKPYTEPKWDLEKMLIKKTTFELIGDERGDAAKKLHIHTYTHRSDPRYTFTVVDGVVKAVSAQGIYNSNGGKTYSVAMGRCAHIDATNCPCKKE